jgi:hypothetical protein
MQKSAQRDMLTGGVDLLDNPSMADLGQLHSSSVPLLFDSFMQRCHSYEYH